MLAAYLFLFLLTAVWGLTFPLVQSALTAASPLVFVALRFVVAGLLFPLLFLPRVFKLSRSVILKGAGLGILLWGGFAFQTIGLAHTTAARSGFLTGTLVPMTPLFAWLIFRARIGLRPWLAALLAFAGTAVMAQPAAGGLNFGDVLTLICAACFALHVVFVNYWATPENDVQLTWVQIAVTAALALLVIPLESPPRLEFSPTLLWAVAVTAVFATALGIWAQLRYQPRITPTAAAIIYAFEPLFAGGAAWVMLGTVPASATLIGAACIFAAMLLSSVAPKVKPEIP